MDRAVAITEFITLHCQSAVLGEYSLSGKVTLAVDHVTITVKAIYAAMVKLFPRYTVRHAAARRLIVQMFMFAVAEGFLLVEVELGVVEAIAIKQANKFVVLAEFSQKAVARVVVALTIITLPNTFVAMGTYYQNQQEQLAAALLITIHHFTYAVAITSIQNRLVLTAVPRGASLVVLTIMESQ